MEIIRAPEWSKKKADIFLAGSILSYGKIDGLKNPPDQDRTWRSQVIEKLSDMDGLIFDPDRIDFPRIGSREYFEQIDWEREHLGNSNLAVFWLSASKPTSYASRVEIGFALGLGMPIIIGIEKGFHGIKYIEAFLKTKPEKSIDGLVEKVRKELAKKYGGNNYGRRSGRT